jgi:gluconolactonase
MNKTDAKRGASDSNDCADACVEAASSTRSQEGAVGIDRRSLLVGSIAVAGAGTLASGIRASAAPTDEGRPRHVVERYPDDVWRVHDERFRKYMIGNTQLYREFQGAMWAEGSAWNMVGQYVVFSDIPNNRQLRWDATTGAVTTFRSPSNFSNGNTFDFQGRQLTCEHSTSRLVRYGWGDGPAEVLADNFEGTPLNAPNDVVVHPEDGGIIFTDPGYGQHWWYEGGVRDLLLPTSIYHLDPQTGTLARLTNEIFKPNGIAFSPDYRTLYVADTAPTHHPGEKARILAWDLQDNGRRLTNRRVFVEVDAGFHDGIRCDRDGNVWAATAFGGEGIDGVHCYAPDGTRLGQIVMPEGCANLCFVGPRRNRLFICGSQSVYTLYTAAQGAHIT